MYYYYYYYVGIYNRLGTSGIYNNIIRYSYYIVEERFAEECFNMEDICTRQNK